MVTSLRDRRVLSPTSVGVVAPGPDSSRGRRTLSGTPRPDTQVHHTTGAAVSPVRASLDRSLAKPRAQDQGEEDSGRYSFGARNRRQKTQPRRPQDDKDSASKTTRADERRGRGGGRASEEEETRSQDQDERRGSEIHEEGEEARSERRARPARVRPLWSGAPPFAPPRFWLHLPSGSFPKRGVPHSRQRHTALPPIGASCPTPFRHTSLEGFRRKNPAKELGGKNPTGSARAFVLLARSRTVSDSETVAAWSVEDGVRKRA